MSGQLLTSPAQGRLAGIGAPIRLGTVTGLVLARGTGSGSQESISHVAAEPGAPVQVHNLLAHRA